MSDTPGNAAAALIADVQREFRRRLQGEYTERIGRCLELLDESAIWQRPSPACNSIGNLILHLCGNVTQWILVPFDNRADARDRDAEFAAVSGPVGQALLEQLSTTVAEACDVVDRLTAEELLAERLFQARYRETGLAAVLHVLEHFSGHAGQIYAWTKQTTGRDLAFYDL